MSELRILTVRQPYAWAIIHGGKDIENRSRNIAGTYRGPVAIHAALKGASFDAEHPELWPFDERHTTGVIIGIADLIDVHHSESCAEYALIEKAPDYTAHRWMPSCSKWADFDTAYHLKLANPRALANPISYRGGLGLRHLPDDITAQILENLGEPQ